MNDIQRLIDRRFVVYDGLVFFARDMNDECRIRKYINDFGPSRAQAMVNHEHLHFYAEAVEEQESLAKRLERVWSDRLASEHPELPTKVEAINEGGAWVVSVVNRRIEGDISLRLER